MEIMLKNKNGFQVNISLSIFFIAFCDLFTDFPSYMSGGPWWNDIGRENVKLEETLIRI
jgi:hypothetical protein